jgi:F1F0 ATPase subunit 2
MNCETFGLCGILSAFGLGLGLGVIYFGGLWITVRRIPHVLKPRRLLWGSLVVRLALCLSFFYALLNHDWQLLVAAMFGFLAIRFILLYPTSRPKVIVWK